VIVVGAVIDTEVAGTAVPPATGMNCTDAPEKNPVPVMVTCVPPPVDPPGFEIPGGMGPLIEATTGTTAVEYVNTSPGPEQVLLPEGVAQSALVPPGVVTVT
jgi:hypothetical protein